MSDFRMKGGNVKLHPAKDGLIPLPDERGITRRDKGGNPLIDVVSPQSGFCTGVRSPLTTTGKSVIEPTPASAGTAGTGMDVRFDQCARVYYDLIRSSGTDPIGLVVRTVADGDDLLPITRVRVVEAGIPIAPQNVADCTAPVRKSDSARDANTRAAEAVIRSMGFTGTITRQMRTAALEMIALERAHTGQ